jgi:hypothetical protein
MDRPSCFPAGAYGRLHGVPLAPARPHALTRAACLLVVAPMWTIATGSADAGSGSRQRDGAQGAALSPAASTTAPPHADHHVHAVSDDELRRLARDQSWLRLLHYRNARGIGLSRSRVISRDFFLHPRGHRDAEAELRAFLEARDSAASSESARAAYCRFPARAAWVEERLGLGAPLTPVCPDQGLSNIPTASLPDNLLFVTGYLGNPASAFGHVLLAKGHAQPQSSAGGGRLGSSDGSPLLADALNYGALVPKDENPVRYAVFGLFGGYLASFAPRQAHLVHHQYRELENRTLWAFPLQLTPGQQDMLARHLKELQSARFRYFFVRDNCGFEMIELLAVVAPEARPARRPWSLPIDALFAAERAGAVASDGAAAGVWLARDQRFRTAFEALPMLERMTLRRMFRRGSAQDKSVRALSVEALDAALLFAELIDEDEERQDWRGVLLAERVGRPAGAATAPQRTLFSPLDRPPASSVAVGATYDASWEPTLLVQAGYQDLLTQNIDRVDWGVFRVGELRVRAPEGSPLIDAFELLAVERFGTESTGMPGDSGNSWGLQFSPYVHSDSGDAGAEIGGQWGWFVDVGSSSGLFALVTGQARWLGAGPSAAVGPELGIISHPARWLGVELRGAWLPLTTPSAEAPGPHAKASIRLGSSRRADLRVMADVGPAGWSVHPQWAWHW